jgi:hypothetical protein
MSFGSVPLAANTEEVKVKMKASRLMRRSAADD